MTTTTNMSLVLPTDGGSEDLWGAMLNTLSTLIDAHDHSSGAGVKVTPAGININSDLNINAKDLTSVRTTRYENQVAVLSETDDDNCTYVVDGDLYYNNADGTAVQITSGTGLDASSSGQIGGDYGSSTASVIYTTSIKTFTFTSSTGVAAKMAVGPILLYEDTSGSNAITIQAGTTPSTATVTIPDTTGTLATLANLAQTFLGNLTFSGTNNYSALTASKGLALDGSNNVITQVALNGITSIDATTETTLETAIDALSNLVTVGALDSGSITSGFGSIDNGASAITTTGIITGGNIVCDNLSIDGNTITATTGAVNITPAAGSAIVLDGTINVDAGVVTGATSITSTAFIGTLSTAAQPNITSLGTLTTLTVDNLTVNGNSINADSGNVALTATSGYITSTSPAYIPTTTITYGATQAWDTQADPNGRITMTGNITSFSAPSNVQDGGTYELTLVQDGTGGYTVSSWNAVFLWIDGTAPTLNTTANAVNKFVFKGDSSGNLEQIGEAINVT